MKKLLTAISILLATSAYAWGPVMMGGGVSGGSEYTFTCSGDANLICDTYDATGGDMVTCNDDGASEDNCYEAYTAGGNGTITNQASGLEPGTNYAKQITADSGAKNTYLSYSSNSTIGYFVMLQVADGTISGSGTGGILSPNRNGSTYDCLVGINGSTGKWGVYYATSWHDLATGPSVGTTYCVWIDWTQNTADTGCSVYISEANILSSPICTKPAATLQATSTNTEMNYIELGASSNSTLVANPIVYDKFRIGTSFFGDQ